VRRAVSGEYSRIAAASRDVHAPALESVRARRHRISRVASSLSPLLRKDIAGSAGDEDLAIPYWEWDVQSRRNIPSQYFLEAALSAPRSMNNPQSTLPTSIVRAGDCLNLTRFEGGFSLPPLGLAGFSRTFPLPGNLSAIGFLRSERTQRSSRGCGRMDGRSADGGT
jgi:hypothetical protein